MSSIPIWVVRGAKCVCTRDFSAAKQYDDVGYRTRPTIGMVYTVIRAYVAYGQCGIVLAEFEDDHGFDARGFAPVVDDTTEADILNRKRLDVPEQVGA